MAEFVKKKEGFKFGIFDKVPVAASDESILLYREKDGVNGSMVIDNTYTPYAADVRRGKFDIMVTFSVGNQIKIVQQKILIKGYQCYFNVMVEIKYGLQNVREYYFSLSNEKKLEQVVKDCIYTYDKKFDLHESIELKRELEQGLENKMQSLSYFYISDMKLEVQPDSAAKELIDSDMKKITSIHINKNDTDMEINRNKDKIKVQQSERDLRQSEVEQFAEMYQTFGDMASVMVDYFAGKISGERLREMLKEKKKEDLAYLKQGWEDNMLNENFVQQEYSKKIAGGIFSKKPILEIETGSEASIDRTEKYIDVQQIGDDDYL